MDDAEYKKRLDRIYVEHGDAILRAVKARDLAIKALTEEYNNTRGKK